MELLHVEQQHKTIRYIATIEFDSNLYKFWIDVTYKDKYRYISQFGMYESKLNIKLSDLTIPIQQEIETLLKQHFEGTL